MRGNLVQKKAPPKMTAPVSAHLLRKADNLRIREMPLLRKSDILHPHVADQKSVFEPQRDDDIPLHRAGRREADAGELSDFGVEPQQLNIGMVVLQIG